jgi:predicted porin
MYDGDDGGDGVAANIRDLKGFQLLAVHNLSKRTNVYAIYGKSEYIGTTAALTSDRTDFALGIRHSF